MQDTRYGKVVDLPGLDYDEAVERVTEALSEVGFGVLTEIDVREKMREKLDEEFRRYVILGACAPELAYRALQAEDAIGLLLPCNVVVAEDGDGAQAAYLRPREMMGVTGNDALAPVAEEAEERLVRAFDRL